MFLPFSGSERRRHDDFLTGAVEIRIQKSHEGGLYTVSHAEQPIQRLELDLIELQRLKGRAMKFGIPVTTCQPLGEPGQGGFSETTKIGDRLDSRGTLRPSCQRLVERFGQRRLLSASYHWDGRIVPPAVVSGGERAYERLGVMGSQALRSHDEETGCDALPADDRPAFNRQTYSGADEVHINALPENNLYRRAGQPYQLSVAVQGGDRVAVCFLTEEECVDLRRRLDETMLVIHQDGKPSTQRGWGLGQVERLA
jgi:hypothetical protein